MTGALFDFSIRAVDVFGTTVGVRSGAKHFLYEVWFHDGVRLVTNGEAEWWDDPSARRPILRRVARP